LLPSLFLRFLANSFANNVLPRPLAPTKFKNGQTLVA